MIFNWVNDPVTRMNSLNSREITYQEHCAWYEKKIRDPNSSFFVYFDEGEPVGVLRCDFSAEKGKWYISIHINPVLRGKGYGQKVLVSGVSKVMEEKPDLMVVHAQIKTTNIPSIQIFKKAGFEVIHETDGVWELEKKRTK